MANKAKLAGTFTLNHVEPIHRWYSYIEGYSSALVEHELDLIGDKEIETIYDPFAGTGTTLLSASMRGIVPYFSETNPFMNGIVRAKINTVISVASSLNKQDLLLSFIRNVNEIHTDYQAVTWDGFEKYFDQIALADILMLKTKISEVPDDDVKVLLMVALSSILVKSSKMIRRGDLRFAKENERRQAEDVKKLFYEKATEIYNDVVEYGAFVKSATIPLAVDSRKVVENNIIDAVITSPPYLNGTNYIRNTKLELKLNDYVKTEKELAQYHSKGIVAGINNVSKRNTTNIILPEVEQYYDEVKEVSYDTRIPIMIANYFNDMNCVFKKLYELMRPNGTFVMDIGDSQFAGVHIPTDKILGQLCNNNGFELYETETLRTRRSKNGMTLTQSVMRFRINK